MTHWGFHHRTQGFSILEVIIAATILGVGLVGSIDFFVKSQRSQEYIRRAEVMFKLQRQLSRKLASASSIAASIAQEQTGSSDVSNPGNANLTSCVLSPFSISQCDEEAQNFPGLSYSAYFQDEFNLARLAGTEDNPVRYTVDGDLCTIDCSNEDHIAARAFFVVNCSDNNYKVSKCSRFGSGGQNRYQADVIYVLVELEYISRQRNPNQRWNCRLSRQHLHRTMDGIASNRAVYVVPEPAMMDACERRAFYIPIAVEKIASAFSNDGCNEFAVVVGYETNGRPICSCIPPFQPEIANGQVVENNLGVVCRMDGICPPDTIFRGYQVFDNNENEGLANDLRTSSKPICLSFDEAYTQPQNCDGSAGDRLSQFSFDCRITCSLTPSLNCVSDCSDNNNPNPSVSQCYQPQ